jgi:hypothetical protein
LRAIGGAAVVNRLAHFYLEKRGARVTAASRQIARKRYSTVANRRTRWSCGTAFRRAACDGLRSGPVDPDPNDGPAARFAAEAARYGDRGERAFRSEQALPAMGRAAAPAILSQTTVLRPVSQPGLLATGSW